MAEQHLQINGEERPFLMGTSALRALARKKGKTDAPVTEVMGEITFSDYDYLIWASLKLGAQSVGEKFEASPEDVSNWLDEDMYALEQAQDLISEATDISDSLDQAAQELQEAKEDNDGEAEKK